MNMTNSKYYKYIFEPSQTNDEFIMIDGENYWYGPYGCIVPERVSYCIAKDGYNKRYRDGAETEMYMNVEKISEQEWLSFFTIKFGKFNLYNIYHNNYPFKR